MTLRILGLALQTLGDRKGAVAAAIFLPSALLIAADTFGPWTAQSAFEVSLFVILRLMAYSWLAISIHRIVLLGETFRIRWGWRETRFAGWLLMISFFIGLAIWFIVAAFQSIGMPDTGAVATTFELFITVSVLYWVSQYFLIFPAMAVDHKYSTKHSSVDVEESRIPAFMVVAVFPVLLSLVQLPAQLITNPMVSSMVGSVLSIVSIAIGVAMLSILYRELSRKGA